MSCLLNTTFCQMKLNKWKELILVSDKILEFDEKNCKALYRKSLALKELTEYQKAFDCIEQFLKKIDDNLNEESKKDLVSLKNNIEKLLISYKNKEKKMYSQMFAAKE